MSCSSNSHCVTWLIEYLCSVFCVDLHNHSVIPEGLANLFWGGGGFG